MKDLNLLEEVVLDQLNNFLKKNPGMERMIDFDKYLKTKTNCRYFRYKKMWKIDPIKAAFP